MLVSVQDGQLIRDLVVLTADEAQGRKIVDAIRRVRAARVVSVSDRTFLTHLGGKLEVVSRVPVARVARMWPIILSSGSRSCGR